jgi:periplasmic copper chaperone A
MVKTAIVVAFSFLLGSTVLNKPVDKSRTTALRESRSTDSEIDQTDVVIRDGWVQETPASQTITAAYMVIENRSDADITLKAASSPVARVVELHKMELTDGLMRMRRVDSIDIPAGGAVELKPGGYHLMVIGLNHQLKAGELVSLTLQFSNDVRKSIRVPVKPRSAMMKEG